MYYVNKFFFSFPKDDISYNKIANQSKTYYVGTTGTNHMYIARNAVDRNTSTCMRTIVIGQGSPDNTVWWKVDLGGVSNIYSIGILFKSYENYSELCYE